MSVSRTVIPGFVETTRRSGIAPAAGPRLSMRTDTGIASPAAAIVVVSIATGVKSGAAGRIAIVPVLTATLFVLFDSLTVPPQSATAAMYHAPVAVVAGTIGARSIRARSPGWSVSGLVVPRMGSVASAIDGLREIATHTVKPEVAAP